LKTFEIDLGNGNFDGDVHPSFPGRGRAVACGHPHRLGTRIDGARHARDDGVIDRGDSDSTDEDVSLEQLLEHRSDPLRAALARHLRFDRPLHGVCGLLGARTKRQELTPSRLHPMDELGPKPLVDTDTINFAQRPSCEEHGAA
jgi:hypothetical protein